MNTRDGHLKRTYGLSPEQYDAQEQSQSRVCAVCEQPNWVGHNGETKRLVVDHNHATGRNRGLLCDACNKAIGFLKDSRGDSQEIILRLLIYLRAYDGPSFKPYVPDNHATREARQVAWDASFVSETLPVQTPAVQGLSKNEQVAFVQTAEFD